MKFMHLSDLHIGIRLHNYDLRQEQEYVFRQIYACVERELPDAVVIAGDIYDKSVPSAEAVELFDDFLTQLRQIKKDMMIMMISGNHDSPQRIDCFRGILKEEGVYMIGLPPRNSQEFIQQVDLEDEFGVVHFYLLPFVKPSFVRDAVGKEVTSYQEAVCSLLEREKINRQERNVLVSHQFYVKDREHADEVERAQTEVFTVGNIDSISSDCLAAFDYVALGHIHKPMSAGKNTIRYCGTPMAYSLSEEGQEKGILMVTCKEKGTEPVIEKIPLTPLRQVKNIEGTLEELVKSPSDDYVWVTLTEKGDLEVSDMQMRLREAFPHLLGVRNKYALTLAAEDIDGEALEEASPYDLFLRFCPDMDEEDQKIIQDVIHTVKGVV